MKNEKDNQQQQGQRTRKPDNSTPSQPLPDEYSNEANHRGATDLGTEGTKPTASQQQGQGAWRAKDSSNRTGSKSGGGGGGQGAKNKTGK